MTHVNRKYIQYGSLSAFPRYIGIVVTIWVCSTAPIVCSGYVWHVFHVLVFYSQCHTLASIGQYWKLFSGLYWGEEYRGTRLRWQLGPHHIIDFFEEVAFPCAVYAFRLSPIGMVHRRRTVLSDQRLRRFQWKWAVPCTPSLHDCSADGMLQLKDPDCTRQQL